MTMKFFNLDLHISVIEDIKGIFNNLGHTLDSKSISNHNWVFNRKPDHVDIISQNTWKGLDQEMCDSFYNRYKEELSEYDGFVVTYPPSFSLLFERFDKPIITVAATRYEAPFSADWSKWRWFNDKLIKMIDREQLIPITNNLFDKYYCETFTKREWKYIPSLCEYTNAKYTGIKKENIISARSIIDISGCRHIRSLGRHSWEDLYSYQSIIHIPYNFSVMSIFEQYTANVPMFFPSEEFGLKLSTYLSEVYFHPNVVFDELEEMLDAKTLALADYYDNDNMPFLQLFDSFEHLDELLKASDFKSISHDMRAHNILKRKDIYTKWASVLKELE